MRKKKISKFKQTPKGKAEQIFIIEHEGKQVKVMNWHGYAVQIGSYRIPFFFNAAAGVETTLGIVLLVNSMPNR